MAILAYLVIGAAVAGITYRVLPPLGDDPGHFFLMVAMLWPPALVFYALYGIAWLCIKLYEILLKFS